jgi:hypothetical protein
MRQRLLTFAVFGIGLIALGEWGLRSGKFAGLDQTWLEFCIGNAGSKLKAPAVTVVRIDDSYEPLRIGGDETLSNDGSLSRLDYATILAFVAKFQPRSVAFLPTPSFDETLTLNKTDIAPLKDAAMQLPKLVVASAVSNDGEQAREATPLAYAAVKVEGDATTLLPFTRTVRVPDAQILANGIPAPKTVESARDLSAGGVLRVPLVVRRGDLVVPSLLLSAVANHAGIAPDQITVKLDDGQPRVLAGDVFSIPIENDGTLIVPDRAGLGAVIKSTTRDDSGAKKEIDHFTSLTVEELAYTGEANDEVAKRILSGFQSRFDSLKDNLVLIGFDRTSDRRLRTGSGETLSETTLLARAAATIQSGRHLRWWPSWARWLAVFMIFAAAAILFRLPRGKFLPAALVTGLVFLAAKVMVFSSTLSWTPPFFVLSLLSLLLAVGWIVPGDEAAKEKG